jgi:hypothetical protein
MRFRMPLPATSPVSVRQDFFPSQQKKQENKKQTRLVGDTPWYSFEEGVVGLYTP